VSLRAIEQCRRSKDFARQLQAAQAQVVDQAVVDCPTDEVMAMMDAARWVQRFPSSRCEERIFYGHTKKPLGTVRIRLDENDHLLIEIERGELSEAETPLETKAAAQRKAQRGNLAAAWLKAQAKLRQVKN
jgi:hypothetical protein